MTTLSHRSRLVLAVAGVAALIALTDPAAPIDPTPGMAAATTVPSADRDCRELTVGRAACLAAAVTGSDGVPLSLAEARQAGYQPFTPAELRDAYRLPSELLGSRQTIAVVVPYDHPDAEADLAVYRAEFGLPPCDQHFPCFRKVDQRGGTDFPPAHRDWSLNATVGLQAAAAVCPNCRLLLVEADDESVASLGAAVTQAVAQGADVVAALYGIPEYRTAMDDAEYYHHPGTPVVAPSGNAGFPIATGQLLPAAYPGVVAVGGTTLYRDDNARGWSELAWSGSGSGCSVYLPKPTWQQDSLCRNRTVADVAAVADLNTPVAVYHTYGATGWLAAGGTPVATALIAAVYALAGNAATIEPGPHLYQHADHLFDVMEGATGHCGGGYLCTAGPGYDGPTGLGTPNGIGAF